MVGPLAELGRCLGEVHVSSDGAVHQGLWEEQEKLKTYVCRAAAGLPCYTLATGFEHKWNVFVIGVSMWRVYTSFIPRP